MGTYIKKNNKYERKEPKEFTGDDAEREFSNLLIHNPEIFPDKWYEPASKWIPISVEMKLDTGYLDILGIDDGGAIYIIESKLGKNYEIKRTVRQQVADYYYALLKLAKRPDGWEKFCDKIKIANSKDLCKKYDYAFHNKNLEEIMEQSGISGNERDVCLNEIKYNFQKGNYTLVIATNIIPRNLRISIDGQNEIDAKHKIPTFALEINEFKTNSNEEMVVSSTYPYDLAEIKQRKSAIRGEDADEDAFQKKFDNNTKLTDEQKEIFNEVRKEIENLADDRSYGKSHNPIFYPYFDTVAGGDRAPLSLGSDGNFQFCLDKLYDYVNNAGPNIETMESNAWKEKILTIPELKKIYDKTGKWSRYNKPEEWMPVHKDIIKIVKDLIPQKLD